MAGRFEVWLDDVALSSVSPDAYIRDVKYTAPTIQDTIHGYGGKNGAAVSRRYVGSISVTVDVEVHIYNTVERQRVCEDIAAWASGSKILRTSDKPDRRLNVLCQKFPVVTSALSWTDAIPITFVAYALPYWEDNEPTTLSLHGTSDSGEMYGVGYADRPFVTAVVEVVSGPLTTLALTVGQTAMRFSGLNVASGNSIVIGYDSRHILTIDANGTSLYNKRNPTSSDDLRLELGVSNSVSVSASSNVDVTLSARGLYW